MMEFHDRDWGFGYRPRLQTHNVQEQGYTFVFRCKMEREKTFSSGTIREVSLFVIRPQIETNAS